MSYVEMIFKHKLTLMARDSCFCLTLFWPMKRNLPRGSYDSLLFNPHNLLTLKDKFDRILIISLNPIPDSVSAVLANGAVSFVKRSEFKSLFTPQ